MESALPLVLFLALLFLLALVILVGGLLGREQERAARGALTLDELFDVTPLLAPIAAAGAGAPPVADPRMVTRLERHLQSEHAIVSAFLSAPSQPALLERLTRTPAPDEAWLAELKGFLARERAAVRRFVSSPSVALLYREGAVAAVLA